MKNRTTILFRHAFAWLGILGLCGTAGSAAPDSTGVRTTVRVTAVASHEFSAFENRLMSACRQAVLDKGFKTTDKPDVELFVAGSGIPGSDDLLALSLVAVSKPLEKLVTFAGEHEVFYLSMGEDRRKLPAEGKEARRYMSEEYMRQFGQVEGHRVFIVRKSRLSEDTAEAVGALLSNWTILR